MVTSASRAASVRMAVVALCLLQFIDVLGETVVIAALPRMLSDLGGSSGSAGLIATSYAAVFAGLLMLGARLGDRYGHRRVVLIGLIIFAAAAAVGATAPSVTVMTVGRCLQGAAAGLSVPSALRLLTSITPEGELRRRAVAVWSAAGAAAGASGLVVGGAMTSLIGWRFVYWAYLPLAGMLLAMILWAIPAREHDEKQRPPLNAAGAVVFTAAVVLLVVATSVVHEPGRMAFGLAMFGGALVLASLFVLVDRRAPAPLLPRGLLRLRALRHGTGAALLNTLTTSSTITLVTLYLQDAVGHSPLVTGLMLVPFSLAVIIGSALAAPVLARWSPQRVVALGLTAIALSDATLIVAAPHTWALPPCVALGGFGIGLASVASTSLGTSVPDRYRGAASGMLNTAAQLGTAIGIAVLLMVAAFTTGRPAPGGPVPAPAWLLATLIALAGAAYFLHQDRADRKCRS